MQGLCAIFASNSRFMRLFQAALDTSLNSPLLCQPLSSRFALHGLRALEVISVAEKWANLRFMLILLPFGSLDKRANEPKQLLGIVPEKGCGSKLVHVLHFSWTKRETQTKYSGNLWENSKTFPGQSRDSPGTAPWEMCLQSAPIPLPTDL